jgi:cyclase
MRNGALVKGKSFNSSRIVGNVQQAAEIHQARGVDELIILDVAATLAGRGPDLVAIKKLTEKCFMPITVGGGITSVEQVRDIIQKGGADKVVIGTAAYEEPGLITRCAKKFGSQAIVVAVDAKFDGHGWVIATRCGSVENFYSPVTFAQEMEARGAGEIIITGVVNDGMMCGYDLRITRKVAKAVSIPVIANGGCGSYQDMHRALGVGASAVAAGACFQFLDLTPKGAAEYLASKGWETRL